MTLSRVAACFLTTLGLNPPLALLALAALLPGSAWACEKSLRWDDDPPFSMRRADGSVGGIDVDLNREALARLGCQARLVKLPWGRALKELELGRLEILPGAFRKPEREAYAYFSGALPQPSRNILFMHVDALERWPVNRLLDLQDTPFRLGAQINVSYGPDYQQLMDHEALAARVALVASRESLWQMIDRGRIDGIIADEHSGVYELRALGLDERIKPSDVVVSTEAAEVAFSKRALTPAFVSAYAATLEALVDDGSYARIVQRYLAP
jgi:polar amino acid transport system substrate-binding protein